MRIICELGQNTNGDVGLAHRMIDAAKDCGADGVKVQAYKCHDFLPEGHPDWAMFEANRLEWDEIDELRQHAFKAGLEFGATPTSLEGIRILQDMEVDFLKNGSDFLLRHDMIKAMLDTQIETWVSIGMASYSEIIDLPYDAYRNLPGLMICTSLYPCSDKLARLNRHKSLVRWRRVGYSDHTEGIEAAFACATIRRYEVFEKHFTLDKTLPGPDHAFSAEPAEISQIVRAAKRIPKMMSDNTQLTKREKDARERWRVGPEPGMVRPL